MNDTRCPVAAGEHVGEYRVQEILGSGGMGWVLAAVHPVIEKKAAIKLLKPALAEDRDAMERFVAEAKAVNRIGHPNIVDIFAFGHTHGQIPYFVMEFLNAGSLRRLLKNGWSPSPRELVSLLDGVLSALQAAHDNGIVHRDLKPDNICIHKTSDRIVTKLVDFGVAKFTEAGIKAGTTRSGVPIGTPTYMAPEQCRGRKVDHRADIYALGVILYEAFTGQVPFASDSYLEVLLAHVEQQPRAPSELADISPEFESIVLRCLAKNPDQRPQSVAKLRGILRTAAGLRERSHLDFPSLDSLPAQKGSSPASASLRGKTGQQVSTVPSPSEISVIPATGGSGIGLGPGPAPDPALSPTISSESLQAPSWSPESRQGASEPVDAPSSNRSSSQGSPQASSSQGSPQASSSQGSLQASSSQGSPQASSSQGSLQASSSQTGPQIARSRASSSSSPAATGPGSMDSAASRSVQSAGASAPAALSSTHVGSSQSASSPSLVTGTAGEVMAAPAVDSQKTWDMAEPGASGKKPAWILPIGIGLVALIAVIAVWSRFRGHSPSQDPARSEPSSVHPAASMDPGTLGSGGVQSHGQAGRDSLGAGRQARTGKRSDEMGAQGRDGETSPARSSGPVLHANSRTAPARQRKSALPRTTITVRTLPRGALVFVDGRRCGPSPAVCRVPAGTKWVRIRAVKAGWRLAERKVDPGKIHSMTLRLRKRRRGSSHRRPGAGTRSRPGPRSNDGFVVHP